MLLERDSPFLGNYRLSARIATGGMAEVYLARKMDADGGPRGPNVAVKRLLPHLASDRRVVMMFINEARITAQVNHPNVVRILELQAEGPEPFIAMELLEGCSFAELRQEAAERGQRVPLGVTLRVLVEACSGLDAAHRAVDQGGRPLRIVHRDFTPDNIHVGANGAVKVIDFGIAKAEAIGIGTEPGTLKGKFFYMSPEMIAGREVDHRADLFAAGVMLYEQLCGRRPFTGLTSDEVLQRIAEGRPRPPTGFDPSVPSALELVCLTALAKDPERRFDSLQAFTEAIEQVGGAAEVASPAEVAAYVDLMFPRDRDPKRQALYRARQADPSSPAVAGRAPAPAATPVPAPVVPAPEAPRTAASNRRRGIGGKLLAGVAVSAVLAAGLGAALYSWQSGKALAPEERLHQAATTRDKDTRSSLLKELGTDERSTPSDLTQAGALLVQVEAWPEALALAEAFLERDPDAFEAHLLAGRAASALRMAKRAEKALTRAEELAPKDLRPKLLLAELRENQGDVAGALAVLASAYELRGSSPQVAPKYGVLLSQAGKLEEASAVLGAWVKDTGAAEALAELAFVRYRQSRFDDAAGLARRALRRSPKLAVAHYYLGAVLFQQGDIAGAERSYLEAERLEPKDARALSARCQLYAHSGNTTGLEEARRALTERFPESAQRLVADCGVTSP